MVRTAWNKGITIKDNPKLLDAHKRGIETRKKKGSYKANSGTFKKGQTRAHYPKGKKNPKLSEKRKLMFKKGELSIKGEKNPMYGKKANNKQLKSLKLGRIRKGAKNNLWKGGITPINKIKRTNTEYKQWRKNVFKRDNYTCKNCGLTKTYLQAHHIKQVSTHPKLIYDVNNGITLCIQCHKKKHPELNDSLFSSKRIINRP